MEIGLAELIDESGLIGQGHDRRAHAVTLLTSDAVVLAMFTFCPARHLTAGADRESSPGGVLRGGKATTEVRVLFAEMLRTEGVGERDDAFKVQAQCLRHRPYRFGRHTDVPSSNVADVRTKNHEFHLTAFRRGRLSLAHGCPSQSGTDRSPSPITPGLHLIQGGIAPTELDQFVVRPGFADPAIFQHQDTVSHPHGGEAMANQQHRPSLG